LQFLFLIYLIVNGKTPGYNKRRSVQCTISTRCFLNGGAKISVLFLQRNSFILLK